MKERKRFEVIKKISEIIYQLIPEKNVLLTVVDLILPQKGGLMKVYLSIFPEEKANNLIKYLNKRQKTIKDEIRKNIYLRYLPSKVVFYPSSEFRQAEEVLKLIDEAKEEITKKEKRFEN
jgi:ribosome-binding factor A